MSTEACNTCHDPLALHGGARRETQLCILCHTEQTSDPDTGNTVDFKVMIHKIHRGADLPSVQSGTPYQIIGFRNSVHDFSDVVIPRRRAALRAMPSRWHTIDGLPHQALGSGVRFLP